MILYKNQYGLFPSLQTHAQVIIHHSYRNCAVSDSTLWLHQSFPELQLHFLRGSFVSAFCLIGQISDLVEDLSHLVIRAFRHRVLGAQGVCIFCNEPLVTSLTVSTSVHPWSPQALYVVLLVASQTHFTHLIPCLFCFLKGLPYAFLSLGHTSSQQTFVPLALGNLI